MVCQVFATVKPNTRIFLFPSCRSEAVLKTVFLSEFCMKETKRLSRISFSAEMTMHVLTWAAAAQQWKLLCNTHTQKPQFVKVHYVKYSSDIFPLCNRVITVFWLLQLQLSHAVTNHYWEYYSQIPFTLYETLMSASISRRPRTVYISRVFNSKRIQSQSVDSAVCIESLKGQLWI